MGIFNLFPFMWFLILSNHSSLTTSLATIFNDENGGGGAIAIANLTSNAPPPSAPMVASRTTGFKPGIAAIVGVLTTIFSITFLLLLYVKHCKRSTYANASRNYPPSRRNSGINRKVIESLPMFRFSSLQGQKDGLECAVCLNKFDPDEVLRLLPKCKHAFHVECIDIWLESHSTCPLCRYRVDPEDILLVDSRALYNSHSGHITPRSSDHNGTGKENTYPRISGRHSSAGERGSSLEIIVENRRDDFRGRVSLDSWNSRRKTGNHEMSSKLLDTWKSSSRRKETENPGKKSKAASRKDGQLPVQGDKHRLDHRIIISEAATERRWSDVQAADLLYLRSEMLLGNGGNRVINGRSVSEITGMSRYESNNGGGKEERERQEERVVKRWLAWISQSQHQHQHQQQQQQLIPAVHSAISASSSIVL